MIEQADVSERKSDRDSIQVIGRCASVLRAVANSANALSLAEIARHVGLARSTVQRIVKSLEDELFLEQASDRRGYILGRGLLGLIHKPAFDIATAAQPYLRNLAETIDETVDLSVLKGDTALFVANIAGSHRLSALSAIGTTFPLHSTANGKALLACLSSEQRRALLRLPLPADTTKALTDLEILNVQFKQIAQSGIAYDLEEHTYGVCAVGTAFLDSSGRPCAISIPLPRQRFDQKANVLEQPLLQCRDKIVSAVRGTLPKV